MPSQPLHGITMLLDKLTQTTEATSELNNILDHITQTAKSFFKADSCVFFAINAVTSQFIPSLTVAGELRRGDKATFKEPSSEGLAQQVIKEGLILVENVYTHPEYQSTVTQQEGIQAFAALALNVRHGQKSLGVLYLNFLRPQQFSEADRETFRIFADQASLLLQETWLLRRYQEIERIGQEINQGLSTVDALFQLLKQYTTDVLDTRYTLLLAIHQQRTNTLDLYVEEEGRTIKSFRNPMTGACAYTMKTQQRQFIQELSQEVDSLPFQFAHIEGTGLKESFIFVPLTFHDLPLGILSIQHPEAHAYTHEDLFLLQLLANHTALALHNIRLYSSLNQLNEVGQLLTQQPDTGQTLQATARKIHSATDADIVILYSYDPNLKRFTQTPCIEGTVNSPLEFLSPRNSDDIALLMIQHEQPIFADDSRTLYTQLHGETYARQDSFEQREQLRSTAAIPLRVGEESVGVFFVNYREQQRFDITQRTLIEGLAHYAAIAIKNAQVFEMLSLRSIGELNTLQDIDREISRNLNLNVVLDTILKRANEHMRARGAAILLYNAQKELLETAAVSGDQAEERKKLNIPLNEVKGITRWVLENKRVARVGNVHTEDFWHDIYIQTTKYTVSELDVPLLYGDDEDVVGVLNFESDRQDAFSEKDQVFLVTLAGQAVIAIKNAQAYAEQLRLTAEWQALTKISNEIISQIVLDREHVFDLILIKALELTKSELGAVMLYDTDLEELWMAAERGAAAGIKGIRVKLNRGIVGYVATNKRPVNVDPTEERWKDIYVEFTSGTRSEVAVPMLAAGKICGVLNVESPLLNNFNDSDVKLLEGLADLAVIAQRYSESYDQAKREAQRFASLYEAGQELGKFIDPVQVDQAYDLILRIAEEHNQSFVSIRHYHEDTHELELIRASNNQQNALHARSGLHDGVNGQVTREQRLILIRDTQDPPPNVLSIQLIDPKIRSLLVIPIKFQERYYGNLGLAHEKVNYFSPSDVSFFEALALQLAITTYRLESIQESQQLKRRTLDAEKMSAIGQLAFELTHRWENDLGLVESYVNDIHTELENLDVTNTFIDGKLEKIVRAARRVLDLSGQLKQAVSGEMLSEDPIFTDISLVLDDVLQNLAEKLALYPATQIHKEINENVYQIHIYYRAVADILRNLIANALDAMPTGGVITLRAYNVSQSVALEVIDTGVGIPPHIKSKIFDLFFSTKGSSGFGLWSARMNALKIQGDLRVDSEQGKGTTFTLLLPRNRV